MSNCLGDRAFRSSRMEAAIACDYWRKNRQITREITGGGSGGTSDIMAQTPPRAGNGGFLPPAAIRAAQQPASRIPICSSMPGVRPMIEYCGHWGRNGSHDGHRHAAYADFRGTERGDRSSKRTSVRHGEFSSHLSGYGRQHGPYTRDYEILFRSIGAGNVRPGRSTDKSCIGSDNATFRFRQHGDFFQCAARGGNPGKSAVGGDCHRNAETTRCEHGGAAKCPRDEVSLRRFYLWTRIAAHPAQTRFRFRAALFRKAAPPSISRPHISSLFSHRLYMRQIHLPAGSPARSIEAIGYKMVTQSSALCPLRHHSTPLPTQNRERQ